MKGKIRTRIRTRTRTRIHTEIPTARTLIARIRIKIPTDTKKLSRSPGVPLQSTGISAPDQLLFHFTDVPIAMFLIFQTNSGLTSFY